MFNCKYCNKEFERASQLGGHVVFCDKNPTGNKRKTPTYDMYVQTPKKCKQCGEVIPFEKRTNVFCSKSCSARFNNLIRDSSIYDAHSIKLKSSKLSPPMIRDGKRYSSKSEMVNDYYQNPNLCKICSSPLEYKSRNRKTCSKLCYTKFMSDLQKDRVSTNPYIHPSILCSKMKNKRSFPELMLEEFLINLGLVIDVDFIPQYPITPYVVDFYFPKIKTVFEVNGKYWHDLNSDNEVKRTQYIENEGYCVYHFWANDITSKKHHSEIKKILAPVV